MISTDTHLKFIGIFSELTKTFYLTNYETLLSALEFYENRGISKELLWYYLSNLIHNYRIRETMIFLWVH